MPESVRAMRDFIRFGRMPELSYPCQEAINGLCTNIRFSGSEIKAVSFSSVQASEGKSFISMNTAVTFSRLGYRTLFVDCDLRRSDIKNRYQLRASANDFAGLTHYLAGRNSLDEVIYPVADIPLLDMIPVGRRVANSLALVSASRFADMMRQMRSMYDIVLVDAPPVGLLADALQIARFCDGVVLVVKYNTIPVRQLAEIKSQIQRSGSRVLGTVINQVELDSVASKRYNKKYGYQYYYSSKTLESAEQSAESEA